MLLSLCCSVVIMLFCYCVALLLFVLSYVLIVCTVPLPPGVNPIAVDKYIKHIVISYWDCGFEWLSVSCEYCVLSDRGLCDGPITCPEEHYRVWCV